MTSTTDEDGEPDGSDTKAGSNVRRRGFLATAAVVGGGLVAGGMVHAQEAQNEYRLLGTASGWQGDEPAGIAGEKNPTLELVPDQEYTIVWENDDGQPHNLAIRDADGNNIVETEFQDQEGETETLEFTATEEMARYVCEVHPSSMVGDVDTSGSAATETPGGGTDTPEETDTPGETDTPEEPAEPRNFTADLSGENEVPSVDTEASGVSTLELAEHDGEQHIHYDITVEGPWNGCVTQAHIHQGAADESGPVVASLFAADDPVADASGTLVEDKLTAGDLVGPLEGEDLDALVAEIDDGNTYVNVHSTAHPPGEIRGQIEQDD